MTLPCHRLGSYLDGCSIHKTFEGPPSILLLFSYMLLV